MRETATTAFRGSKPDYMIDTVADVFIVIETINERLAKGEKPA